jgi:TonB family protein
VGAAALGLAASVVAQTSPDTVTLPENAPALRGAHKVPPVYPAQAKAKHLEGDVTLSVLIDFSGKVSSVSFVSGTQELAASAAESVMQWVYKPYVDGGAPKKVETQVTIHFRMR